MNGSDNKRTQVNAFRTLAKRLSCLPYLPDGAYIADQIIQGRVYPRPGQSWLRYFNAPEGDEELISIGLGMTNSEGNGGMIDTRRVNLETGEITGGDISEGQVPDLEWATQVLELLPPPDSKCRGE